MIKQLEICKPADVSFAGDALSGIAVGDGGVILDNKRRSSDNWSRKSALMMAQRTISSVGRSCLQATWPRKSAPNATVGNTGRSSLRFTKQNGTWSKRKNTADDGAAGDAFGISMALSFLVPFHHWRTNTNTFKARRIFIFFQGFWIQARSSLRTMAHSSISLVVYCGPGRHRNDRVDLSDRREVHHKAPSTYSHSPEEVDANAVFLGRRRYWR